MADIYLQGVSGFQTILLSSIVAWALWALLKHFVMKHPLDNIPGPPSPSFLTGMLLDCPLVYVFRVDHSLAGREFGTNFRPSRLGVPQESCRYVWWCNQIAGFVWGELRWRLRVDARINFEAIA